MQFPRDGQSYNRYAYVGNRPLGAVDPTGFSVEEVLVTADRIFGYSLDAVAGISSGVSFGIPSVSVNVSININTPALVAIGTGEVKAPGTNQETVELKDDIVEEVTVFATRIDDSSLPPDPSLDPLNGTVDQAFTVDSLPPGRAVEFGVGFAKILAPILQAVTPVFRKAVGPVFKTTKEAVEAAHGLGFKRVKEAVNGQAVFKKGNTYITRDVDGHNGGAWKMADSVKDIALKETRSGTWNADLSKRIGD